MPKRGLFRAAFDDLGRIGKITSVLIKHGLGHWIAPLVDEQALTEVQDLDSSSAAKRVKAVLEELGPTFVKLGQVLSTRPDLLPPAFIRELSKLQDDVPALDFEIVQKSLASAFDQPLDTLFDWINPEPLATASIAQTHRARLKDGRDVVLKVQRPGIEKIIQSDLDLLRILAKVLSATIEEMELYSPVDIVQEFEHALYMELDFNIERQHLELFRHLYADDDQVWIPEPIQALSRKHVLVLEFVDGVKITQVEAHTPRAKNLALKMIDLLYTMLFEHAAVHADPHPGNVLVTDDNRIALIDFGLITRLTLRQQDTLISLIISVVSGDVDGIARAVLDMGRAEARIPMRDFRNDIIDIRTKYLKGQLHDLDLSAFVLDLLEAGQKYRIKIPADWALISKATVSIEGIVRYLYPNIDLPNVLRGYAQKLLIQRYGPQKLAQTLLAGSIGISGLLREIPAQFNQLLMDLEFGGIRVKVEHEEIDRFGKHLRKFGLRLSLSMLNASSLLAWAWVCSTSPMPALFGCSLCHLLAFLCGTTLFLLVWSFVFDGQKRKLHLKPWLESLKKFKS